MTPTPEQTAWEEACLATVREGLKGERKGAWIDRIELADEYPETELRVIWNDPRSRSQRSLAWRLWRDFPAGTDPEDVEREVVLQYLEA